MRARDTNWMRVEEYLERDDRIVLPIGSTEQHAYLSLATDTILAGRIAAEAAEPLGVLVLPTMPFGVAPGFASFPGTVSLRPETLGAVLTDSLEALYGQGFRGFLVVNGHAGNAAVVPRIEAWARGRARARLRFQSWWESPAVAAVAEQVHRTATHASWFENFPWTRLAGVEVPPGEKELVTDASALEELDATAVRAAIGDGSYGGPYAVSDADALRVWEAGVAEVRSAIETL